MISVRKYGCLVFAMSVKFPLSLDMRSAMSLALSLVMNLAVSFSAQAQSTDSAVLAMVNGEPLYRESINLIKNNLEQNEYSSEDILEELINLKLLSRAARNAGLDKSESVAMAIKLQEEQTLAKAYTTYIRGSIKVSDAELRAEYDYQVKLLEKQDYRASHIQFDTEEEASAAMVLLANGADYEELAKTISVSPDSAIGGDLGWTTYGSATFERGAEVEKLEINDISRPLQSSHGWHIFKLTDIRGEQSIPSYDSIKSELQTSLVTAKIKEHLNEMRSEAEIEMSIDSEVEN